MFKRVLATLRRSPFQHHTTPTFPRPQTTKTKKKNGLAHVPLPSVALVLWSIQHGREASRTRRARRLCGALAGSEACMKLFPGRVLQYKSIQAGPCCKPVQSRRTGIGQRPTANPSASPGLRHLGRAKTLDLPPTHCTTVPLYRRQGRSSWLPAGRIGCC
jgi:hypothetical protein